MNDKDKKTSNYEEIPYYADIDKMFSDAVAEFDAAFEKMEALQEKDISARIFNAEEKLNRIDADLATFLNVCVDLN